MTRRGFFRAMAAVLIAATAATTGDEEDDGVTPGAGRTIGRPARFQGRRGAEEILASRRGTAHTATAPNKGRQGTITRDGALFLFTAPGPRAAKR